MKTILSLTFLFLSASTFAQSILLENAMDIYSDVTLQYAYSPETGAAGIQANYAAYDPDGMGDSYNFILNGLSFNKQTEEIIFDNGVNEYVCARIEHKRFVFKYKVLVETGNCKLVNKLYDREVVRTDGVNRQTRKVTYRKLMLVIENSDSVETTNWNVQKLPTII